MALAVFVTIPQDKAEYMARTLLDKKVCACVNVINGVASFFWWEGKIDTAKEALLIIKTKDSLFNQLKKMVSEHHPYTVPEIVAVKIDKINKPYLDWLNSSILTSGIKCAF